MYRRLVVIAAVLLMSLPLWGQVAAEVQNPRIDIFGGYSHVGNYSVGMNGWIGSATWRIGQWLGVEGDVSGDYGSKSTGLPSGVLPTLPSSFGSRMHSFNFGPAAYYFPKTSSKYDAFGHLLFGDSHTNVNAAGFGNGSNSFSWILGGGADYNFRPNWAGRAQLDYLRTNFFNHGGGHGRIALGLVYKFGR